MKRAKPSGRRFRDVDAAECQETRPDPKIHSFSVLRFDEGELEIGLLSLRQFSTLPFSSTC